MSGSPNSWVSGKLGTCPHFVGSTSNVIYNNSADFNYTDNFSYCCWLNPNFTSGATQYAFTVGRADAGGYGYGIAIASATQITTIFGTRRVAVACASNSWHHVAVTIGGGNVKTYVDGVLVNTSAVATVPTYSDGNGLGVGCFHYSGNIYPYYGDLQDLRIYDDVLSAREIAELAKGIMVHYPLNNGSGVPSLADFESVASKWANEGETSVTDVTDASYGNVLKISSVASKRIYRSVSNVWTTSGGKYTVSFLAKASSNGATCDMSRSLADFSPTFTLTTDWKRYSGVITLSGTSTSGTLSFRTLSNVDYYITQVKLEPGEKATPWTPNVSEPSYNSMGYNTTIEYDVSGYNYNGTRTGTFSLSSNTARYSASTLFDGNNYVQISSPKTSSVRAVSFWFRLNADISAYSVQFADYGSKLSFGFINSTSVACTCNSNNRGTFTITAPTANAWYHVVVMRDDSLSDAGMQLYINGVKQTTRGSQNSWNHTTDTLLVGRRSSGSGIVGALSDFRMYSTILTETQVKELYNTPLTLTNNGRLLAQGEYVEI